MNIRPERPSDYAAIAELHARAFGNRAVEASIVALQRQRTSFDPELSLVADLDGSLVGHVLFSPHRLQLLGQSVPAVNLAPIAVDPAHQRRGIGGRLIAEGHAAAAAKGYSVSFLLGHTGYYPRFGYRTRAFGVAQASLSHATPQRSGLTLEQRGPTPHDIPALRALWHHDEVTVDFALDPGPGLLDWLSPNPAIRSAVYLRTGEIVGYTRIHAAEPAKPRVFLARDAATARSIARAIARDTGVSDLVLPIHPAAACASGFVAPACAAWDAAMALSLAPSPLDDYLAQVAEGHSPPGRVTWPVAFDLE